MDKVNYQEIYKNNQLTIKEIHRVVVHRFSLGDVEDPEIYAAEPIYKWQQTDAGKFVMSNAEEPPVFQRHMDHGHYGYEYTIIAKLESKKLTEYYLRWGNKWIS